MLTKIAFAQLPRPPYTVVQGKNWEQTLVGLKLEAIFKLALYELIKMADIVLTFKDAKSLLLPLPVCLNVKVQQKKTG